MANNKTKLKATTEHKSEVVATKQLNLKKVSIKPFIDGKKDNMGLENYDLVLFPNVEHSETIAALEQNGVVRYLTGLDEYAPEVRNIIDDDERNAKVIEIRTVVAHLEREMASNNIDVSDENFWDKVKVIKNSNHNLFSKIEIRVGNKEEFLDPKNNAEDLLKLYAIKAGGFPFIGKSYEDSKLMNKLPKFYLDSNDETVKSRTTSKKSVNKAISLLEKIYTVNPEKLIYMAKVLDGQTSITFNGKTHIDSIYDLLDDFISGKGIDKNKIRSSDAFVKTNELSFDTLKIKALIIDATFYNLIALKPDGMLYHQKTSTMLGRNVGEIVIYLLNPLNEDIQSKLLSEIETYWK